MKILNKFYCLSDKYLGLYVLFFLIFEIIVITIIKNEDYAILFVIISAILFELSIVLNPYSDHYTNC